MGCTCSRVNKVKRRIPVKDSVPAGIRQLKKQLIPQPNDSERKTEKKKRTNSVRDEEIKSIKEIKKSDDHEQSIHSLSNSQNNLIINVFVEIEVANAQAFNDTFVQQRQQVIDNHSYRSTIESWQSDSLQQLTETIKAFSNGKSSVDCHWIIYYWIACNIEYDTVSYFAKDYKDQSAEGVFRTKKGVCAGYANIYKYLCDQLHIPCEVIGGYSKGYGFDDREGAPTETDHAWNATEIDGHWYLMESTWGAGHLNKQKTFERKLNCYYFFPRPNEMIYHHLPEDEKWQLLRKPVQMKQYLQMPKIHPVYFQLNLEMINPRHQGYVDLLPNEAYALVLIRAPSDVHLTANLKLHDQVTEGGHRLIFDNEKQLYCCYFAPSTVGKHKITIYGKPGVTEIGTHEAAIDLTLDIKQMPTNPISFPKMWKQFFDLNLNVISPINTHLIKVYNGNSHAEVLIQTPNDVELLGRLVNADGEEIEGGQQVFYDRHKGLWRCKFAPNRDGMFDAQILAKKKSDTGLYNAAVSFKIDAKDILTPPLSYPKTQQLFYDLDLKIEAPRDCATAVCSENVSFTEIRVSAPDDIQLLGRLVNVDGEEIEGGQQVFYDRHKGSWQCKFAPNRDGMFDAQILAKKKSDTGVYNEAVSFKIVAKDIPTPPLSYPKTRQLFYDLDLKIEEPRDCATAVRSENVLFTEIRVSAPDDVELLGRLVNADGEKIEGGQQVFYDRQKGLWRCKFAPNCDGMFDAQILAKKKSESGVYNEAVSFKIDAKDTTAPPLSYPETQQLFYDLDLKIEAPRDRATVEWTENASFCEIRVSAPDDVQLSCEIEYNGVKEDNCAFAQWDNDKQEWQLLFAPQRTGPHKLFVYGRRQSDTQASSHSVVSFSINVTELQELIKFPLVYTKFQSNKCRIHKPLNGVLKKGAVVAIHCVIPGAKDVDVQVDSNWVEMEGYKDSILKTEVIVGSKDVTIYAKFGENTNYDGLVRYSVE